MAPKSILSNCFCLKTCSNQFKKKFNWYIFCYKYVCSVVLNQYPNLLVSFTNFLNRSVRMYTYWTFSKYTYILGIIYTYWISICTRTYKLDRVAPLIADLSLMKLHKQLKSKYSAKSPYILNQCCNLDVLQDLEYPKKCNPLTWHVIHVFSKKTEAKYS